MKYQRLVIALILLVLMGSVAYGANVITGLVLHGVVQKITPETGDDSLTVRDDSLWIVLNDSTRISFVVGYAPGSARLQGGVNKVIEFAFDSVFIDVDSNSANPMILFGNFGGGLRWNRATDKIQFNNDLTGGWSDIGTSAGISEADYNSFIKNGLELKNKIDSTVVHIPVSDSAAGGADRAESAQGLTGYSLNGTDKPADGEVLTYYSDQDSLGWTAGGGGGLTEEQVEDYVGTMVDGGTETRIEVTYTDGGDGAGLLNFVVDDMNDGDAAESEIHDSLDAHWTDFTTLDLDEIGNPSGDHTFAMANKDLKFTWTVGGGYDGGLELEATGNYSDEDLMHIHFHTGDVGDIDLLHIESDDPDVTALHTYVPQAADTNAYFDNGVVFIDRADIDSLDIDGDVIVDLTGMNLSVTSNILNVDSEPWDSVTAWANLVNDDRDSVLAFSPIVSEAKDSLTSWANEVNAATDHVADNSQAHTDYMLNTGDVATGVYDFGGATSFEIPAVNNPATTAEGQIAWDANDDAIEVYMGDESESALIPAYQKIDVLIFAPDGVNDKIPIFRVDALLYPFGIEIDQVSITIPSDGAYTMVFEEWAADPPAEQNIISTVTTGGSDSYMEEAPDNDAALDADDYIFLDIPVTDVDWIHCQVIFHVVAGD